MNGQAVVDQLNAMGGIYAGIEFQQHHDDQYLIMAPTEHCKMTLTAPGCGMGPTIAAEAKSKILLTQGSGPAMAVSVRRFAPSDPNLHNASLQAMAVSAAVTEPLIVMVICPPAEVASMPSAPLALAVTTPSSVMVIGALLGELAVT